jgi:hypothetical protein
MRDGRGTKVEVREGEDVEGGEGERGDAIWRRVWFEANDGCASCLLKEKRERNGAVSPFIRCTPTH